MRRHARLAGLRFHHVLVALALGFVLNLGLAWYSALSLPLPISTWELVPTGTSVEWPIVEPEHARVYALPCRGKARVSDWPARLEIDEVVAFDITSTDTLALVTRRDGWPWPAVAQHQLYRLPYLPHWRGDQTMVPLSDGGPRVVASPELTEYFGSFGVLGRQLPSLVVWRGLIGNTLVFGLVLALIAHALAVQPRVMIRRRRAARGRCVACGYDLTGLSTCPECGTAGPPSPVA